MSERQEQQTAEAAPSPSPAERREVRRVSFEEEPLFVALYGGPTPLDLAARLRDLSYHGARLVSSAALTPKQTLVLRLPAATEGEEHLWLSARVVWARAAGVSSQRMTAPASACAPSSPSRRCAKGCSAPPPRETNLTPSL